MNVPPGVFPGGGFNEEAMTQRTLFDPQPLPAHFDGPVYDANLDWERLTGQIRRVFDCMKDGTWRTLEEIAEITGDPHASVSAQLRHLRKQKFGAFQVNKRHRGEPSHGLWEYQLLVGA